MNRTLVFLSVGAFAVFQVACSSPVPQQPSVAQASPAEKQVPPPDAKPVVARIVFVDQAECCQCTRDRIDKSWDALKVATADRQDIQVDRVERTADQEQIAAYTAFRPIMVIPAMYFVAADNAVIEVLQGEIRPEQIRNLL